VGEALPEPPGSFPYRSWDSPRAERGTGAHRAAHLHCTCGVPQVRCRCGVAMLEAVRQRREVSVSVGVILSDRWKRAYPGAMAGILAMHGVANPDRHTALQDRAAQLQAQIRTRFAGSSRSELVRIPTLRAYAGYYKRFGKTYHVQLQLESVLFKGKAITGPSAIVQAMLMAELESMLLTAGHDLETVGSHLAIDVSLGTERYTLLSGTEQTLKAGDMFIRGDEGILSSIVYGPDRRTRITPQTRAVLFTVYAPPGIPKEELETHLTDLEANVRLFSPHAELDTRDVFTAG
jgi:DNA/RNA-binding domain of Phe-tRNA-synthetase-like protein